MQALLPQILPIIGELEAERRVFSPGQVIVEQGAVSNQLYLVESGQARVVSGEHELARLQGGEIIGEISYYDGQPHSATVIAETPTAVILFSRSALEKLSGRYPELMNRLGDDLLRSMVRRLRDTTAARCLLEHARQDLLESQARLLQVSQMATLGRLTAAVAHELNNPLAAVARGAQQLGDCLSAVLEPLGLKAAFEQGRVSAPCSTVVLRRARRSLQERFPTLAAGQLEALLALDEPQRAELEAHPERLAAVLGALELAALVETVQIGAERAAQVVQRLRSYARTEQDARGWIALEDGLEQTLAMLRNRIERQGVTVERDYAQVPRVLGCAAELNQVWTNLISNALEAMSTGGHLKLSTSVAPPGVLVTIEDDGTGIPTEHAARIFEVSFTTRDFGLGLGLAICKTLIERHQGRLSFESRPGHTSFLAWLPIGEEAS